MRLALRLALTFGLLAAASSAAVGVTVREQLVATETSRFREEVNGLCEAMKTEVRRQGDADHTLITGFCEGGELVERVGIAADTDDIDSRRLSFASLVRTERSAFGMDELLVAIEGGHVAFGSPPALAAQPPNEIDAALKADPSGFTFRTESPPALVNRCTKTSPKGKRVGMVAARHLDPLVAHIAETLKVTIVPAWPRVEPKPAVPKKTAGKSSPSPSPSPSPIAISSSPPLAGGAERTACMFDDGRGGVLRFDVVKSTHDLEANLDRLDRSVGVLAVIAAVIAFLVAVVLARNIGRPLSLLAAEVGKVAADEASPIRVRGSGEVRELGTAFERMINDLAVMRRRLAAASRVAAWREVARRVAHEVKNPLAPIRAAVETLRRLRAREDPRFDEYFDEATRTVLDEVHRISNIVTEFTRFARLPPPRPQELDAEEVARHVIGIHKASAGDVHLAQVTLRRPPTMRADRDQVIQVLTNLVQNALESVKDRGAAGAVSLTTDTDGHWVTFLVSDNGPGVTPEFAGRLFEPYATTKSTGTGLGLAIAQRIAYEHAGELSYAGPSSTVPGQVGAVFRLVLPIEGPPPQSEMVPTSSEPPG